jgi:hypothetical protein
MLRVRGMGPLALLIATTSVAAAEDNSLYERLWPSVPDSTGLTLEQQITDHLTELGNQLGTHLDTLSNDMLALKFDGRRRRAHVRLGGGDGERYLMFKLDSDVHFTDGVARVTARVDLGVMGHQLHFELPDFEMVPAAYRGDYGVEVRLPLFKRAF